MSKKRFQLTLFIDEDKSEMIEKIRKEFNPLELGLIKSHVPLWREDELKHLEPVIHNLEKLNHNCISIDFGPVVRFSKDKGVIIPANGENKQFHHLRIMVLNGVNQNPRKHEPPITLMHPRNSTCTTAYFSKCKRLNYPVN